jgi:hypothetical protein
MAASFAPCSAIHTRTTPASSFRLSTSSPAAIACWQGLWLCAARQLCGPARGIATAEGLALAQEPWSASAPRGRHPRLRAPRRPGHPPRRPRRMGSAALAAGRAVGRCRPSPPPRSQEPCGEGAGQFGGTEVSPKTGAVRPRGRLTLLADGHHRGVDAIYLREPTSPAPPGRGRPSSAADITHHGRTSAGRTRTNLVLAKPDAMQRGLAGEIIRRPSSAASGSSR